MIPKLPGRMLLLGGVCSGMLVFALGGGFASSADAREREDMPMREHEHRMLEPASPRGEAPTDSIYHLDAVWTDQDGQRAAFPTLRGKARVIAMFYSNCQYVCPLIVDEMKHVEGALTPAERARVDFGLFSFDPERDTQGVLKAYAGKRSLDESRWRLYTGSPDAVLDLAAVLGMRIRKEPNGEFSHSAIITVLDREGIIRYQMLGLGQERAPLLAALRAALKR
jgi:protein SCO1/2